MKSFRHIFSVGAWLATALGVTTLASCRDEILDAPDYTVSGEAVTVTVPLSLPKMEVKSRNALSDEQLNRVQTLWIRTYSAVTGKATSEWVKLAPGTITVEQPNKVSLKSQSGSSYIVGVANPDTNNGVLKSDPDAQERSLADLLDAADTWNGFLDIAVASPSTDNEVNTAPSPLAMAGCYTNLAAGGNHVAPHRIDDWQRVNFEPVFIPASGSGEVALGNGAIHLRRLVSHLTFNIKPGPDVDVSVESYTVCNVPRYTWLYERSDTDGRTANFGNDCTEENAGEYYVTPQQFSGNFITENGDGSSTFDFWQGENKHTALAGSGCDTYNKRERERKDATGAATGVTQSNSGLFTSLTGDVWTPNNMATYVRVRCFVDYKAPVNVDGDGNPVNPPAGDEMYRSGNAEYVVHLGYCEGADEAAKSADFNCFRNVDYTYNLTVNGLNDIRLEAYREEETTPGAEGLVTDVMNPTITLDAHYAAFNIELTETELTNFGYIITAYENGVEHTYTEEEAIPAGEEKYVNWIELRPTTAMNRLARYYPRTYNDASLRSFTLKDIYDGNYTVSASGYYTVFVNEYVYEAGVGEAGYGDERSQGNQDPAWMHYVNQDARRFYIRVTRSISADGQSVYARSKYAVSQQSIQTYYSDREITPATGDLPRGTGIGVERENEVEGLNLRRSTAGTITNPSSDNGRYNVWQWIRNKNNNWNAVLSYANNNYTYVQEMPGVATGNLQGGLALPARTVNNNNPIYMPRLANFGNTYTSSAYDPQPNSTTATNYIEAINACMNRNRDNNGNGTIDEEELRWYVPAMGKYLRVILGRASLQDPIMDYDNVRKLPYSDNGQNTRYLFYSSDGRILWSMEGLSTSGWNQWCSEPWQIRCIRNLGTNLTTVTSEEKVQKAYVHDAATRTISMTYYDINSIRTTPLAGNGDSPGQMPVHMVNSPYNKVYYAFQYAEVTQTGTSTSGNFGYNYSATSNADNVYSYINSNPCSGLNATQGSGWRIPNQKEMAIMRNEGLYNSYSPYIVSCTASYFNRNGDGGTYTDGNNYFLGCRSDGATLLTTNNLGPTTANPNMVGTLYVRCVRDVEP